MMSLGGDVSNSEEVERVIDIQEESLKIKVYNDSYSSSNLAKLYKEKLEKDKIRKDNQRMILEKHKKMAEERKRKEEEERKRKEAERKRKDEERKREEEERKKKEAERKKQEQEIEREVKIELIPNTIGINGIFKSFASVGDARTSYIQSYLDNGNIVASLTYFNSKDNQTTYFSGHNPGVFSYMAQNIYNGAIVTVVDSSGTPTNYIAVEGAYVNTDGSSFINSAGMSVIDLYNYGSGEESIVVQYCIGGTMLAWYCTKA